MFIPEYLSDEEVKNIDEPKVINTMAKDNIVEISANFIEKMFNNIKPYITMIMNFYKK